MNIQHQPGQSNASEGYLEEASLYFLPLICFASVGGASRRSRWVSSLSFDFLLLKRVGNNLNRNLLNDVRNQNEEEKVNNPNESKKKVHTIKNQSSIKKETIKIVSATFWTHRAFRKN